MQLVLASTSKPRYNLLKKLTIPFKVVSPICDETPHAKEKAPTLVSRLAITKAHSVATLFRDALIIGSDQVAEFHGQILGKPGNLARAQEMLTMLSGQTVTFYTGLCLLQSNTQQFEQCVVPTTVTFRHLNKEMIDNYLRIEQPFACAGSFQAEGLGIALFTKLQSDDPSALIGLPLIKLVSLLEQQGIKVLEHTSMQNV